MLLTITISLLFGLVAGLSLASCLGSVEQGLDRWGAIRAELAALDRAEVRASRRAAPPPRQPHAAFALLAV